jgi:hypothetical protein
MPIEWYDPTLDDEDVKCLTEARWSQRLAIRVTRKRSAPVRLGECLRYPLIDGAGVGLLVFLPPALWVLSLPVFDVIAVLEPFTKGNWALGLLVAPIFLPLLFSFSSTLGYVLLFMGQIIVTSALGDDDQPPWPEWDTHEISQGLTRWIWAAIFGVAVGGFPVVLYWKYCGTIDWFDWVVFAELVIVGTGYATLTLAAALLHDSLLAANPITVLVAALRMGWDVIQPCLVAGIALMLAVAAFLGIVFRMPLFEYAAVGLWVFWIFVLYEGMVVSRMIGLTYFRHANDVVWFRYLPRWGLSKRQRLYSNS